MGANSKLDIDGVYAIFPEGGDTEAVQIVNGKVTAWVQGNLHETFVAARDSRQHLTALCRAGEDELIVVDEDISDAACELLGVDPETHVVCRPWAVERSITIYRDDVMSGDGTLTPDGEIIDCPAVLGDDQDESDRTYEAIQDAIESGTDRVETVDGTYTWTIREERV